MIEPVFVGLLAAAFAFLYGELSRHVRYVVERIPGGKTIRFGMTLAEGEDEHSRVLGEIAGDFVEGIGAMYDVLIYSLVPYVVSVGLLVSGYGIGEGLVAVYGVDIGLLMSFLGMVLLVEAFIVSGVLLCRLNWIMVKVSKAFGDRIGEEAVRLYSKEKSVEIRMK